MLERENYAIKIKDWDGDLCPVDPDNCWIDRATGEHVNATTNTRTIGHIRSGDKCPKCQAGHLLPSMYCDNCDAYYLRALLGSTVWAKITHHDCSNDE